MQRYLLFDSGCAVCTRLADDIERASDGWLQARSLRDPNVKVLLDAAKPGWRWEPTLLEVTDGQPRVFTGVALRARVALGLGPRRAWRVAALVRQADVSQAMETPFHSKRRGFLKGAAVLAGGLMLPISAQAEPTSPGKGNDQPNWERLSRAEAAALVAATRSSTYYQSFTANLTARFAAGKDTALLGRGDMAFVALPVMNQGKTNGSAFAAVVDRKLQQVKEAMAWTIEDTVDGHHAKVQLNGRHILDAIFDDAGNVVTGWIAPTSDGNTQDITGRNFVAEGQSAVNKVLDSLGTSTTGTTTQQETPYQCLTRCLSDNGVPLYILTLIGALCAVVCLVTVGLGCFLCIIPVLGGFAGVGAGCLRRCGFDCGC